MLGMRTKNVFDKSAKKQGHNEIYNGFTIAEVLITLSIIGIVAALTIPGVVKHHNEKAWATGQDLFMKKLEVALKSMNTQGRLAGHATTADFVNELKKNIKINKVCTDDVTKCFSKEVVKGKNKGSFEITNTSINYESKAGYDWAETVGVQFNNGVTALIAYNKQCYADPYDNQNSVSAACIGITYDVTGNKKPNTVEQDLTYNANVVPFGCVYVLKDGTCFAKILGPQNGGYRYLSNSDCVKARDVDQTIDVTYCHDGNDYYAGAVLACGGKKANLPNQTTLHLLAQELYNDPTIPASGSYGTYNSDGSCSYSFCTNGFAIVREKASSFFAQFPEATSSTPPFYVWSSVEGDSGHVHGRVFRSYYTNYYYINRDYIDVLAVCLGD